MPLGISFTLMSKGFFILLFFVVLDGISQEKSATSHYSLGDSLFHADEFDSAYYHFSEASILYKDGNLLRDYYDSRSRMQEILERKGKYTESTVFGKNLLDSALQSLDENDLVIGDIYARLGLSLDYSNEFDSALTYYYKALRIRISHPEVDKRKLVYSYRSIATVYSIIHNLDSTVKYSNKALAIIKGTEDDLEDEYGKLQNNLANTYADHGMKDAALESYESALIVFEKVYGPDHINATITHLNLGFLYKDQWDLNKSKFHFDQAFESVKDDPSYRHLKNIILSGFGEIYRTQGAFEEAIGYTEQAINNLIATEGEDYYQLPYMYNNLGLCHLNTGNTELAGKFLKKAFDMNKEGIYNPRTAFSSVSNLGNILYEKGEYSSALEFYDEAIQICKTEHKIADDLSLALNNKANALLNLGKLNEAYEVSLEVLSTKINDQINYHPELPRFYSIHADILHSLNRYDSAFFYIDKSNNANIASDGALRETFDILDNDTFITNLKLKAIVYRDLFESEGDLNDLKSALAVYHELSDAALNYSIDFNNEKDRLALTGTLTDIHVEAVELANELLVKTGDSTYLDEAFNLFQNSRSISLKHRVSERDLKKSCGIPDSLLLMEAGMKIERKYLRSELLKENEEDSSRNFNDIKNRLLELNKEIAEMKEQYKNYCDGFNAVPQYTREEIGNQLRENQALIQYLTHDNSVYALVFFKGIINFEKLNDLTFIEEQSSYSPDYYYQLYKELIASILPSGDIESLVIIPDGKIWDLNFDLFITESPATENNKELPYLLKKYAVNYAYSFNSLFDNSNRKKNASKQLLAFSFADENAAYGDQISLRTMRSAGDELPGSLNEVRNISELYEGEYVFGNYASEKLFKEIANDYRLLHLAVHGEIDNITPQNSKLFFYAKGDTLEDGRLHAFELYDMELNADLAVLSACNTGSGKIVNGEGVMSLGRAFTYAGVESLLLTRTEVADAFTPRLMQLFYEELKKGKRKSEALRDAKITFLTEADEVSSDPFYWSSFYILGNDSPVDLKENRLNKLWLLAITVLILLTIVMYRFRKKSAS